MGKSISVRSACTYHNARVQTLIYFPLKWGLMRHTFGCVSIHLEPKDMERILRHRG